MKPILLLNAGVAFSATSPLHYTLGWDNKYAHTGHCKEHHYLYILESDDRHAKREFLHEKRQKANDKKPIILGPDSEYVKFKGDYFFNPDNSIDNYIKYYLEHYDNIKDHYKAVADFSNSNAILSEKFMNSIKPKLLENFDVKVIMVFRDPIRRLWSVSNVIVNNWKTLKKNKSKRKHSSTNWNIEPENVIDYIKMCVGGKLEPNAYYHDILRRHRNVWGRDNVHPIIMEEFWAGDTQPLEDFLEFPLPKIHENVYYPDMGSKAPHYDYLKDQWQSDTEDITKDLYEYCLSKIKYIYDEFVLEYGRMPEAWMR